MQGVSHMTSIFQAPLPGPGESPPPAFCDGGFQRSRLGEGVRRGGRPGRLVGCRGEWAIPRDITTVLPSSRGARVLAAGGRTDAFPAMTGPRRPARRLRPARDAIPRLADAIDEFLAHPTSPTPPAALTPKRSAACSKRSASSGQSASSARASSSAPHARHGARRHRRRGTATSRRCGHSRASASAAAGSTRRSRTGSSVAESPSIGPRRSLTRSSTGSWRRDDVAVSEKALWRMLYETAARASEVLALNVEDIDLGNRRAPRPLQRRRHRMAAPPVRHGKAATAAHTRPRQRPAVPRRPAPCATAAPAAADLCPYTGRARLYYRRARSYSTRLRQVAASSAAALRAHPPRRKRSQPAVLMAKSRHTSLRSLQRYARPAPTPSPNSPQSTTPNADDAEPTIPRPVVGSEQVVDAGRMQHRIHRAVRWLGQRRGARR